jgi:uncharacterized protein
MLGKDRPRLRLLKTFRPGSYALPSLSHTADPAILALALALGLGSTLHCMVMCGPLAAAVPMAGGGPRWARLLAYNMGRVASYALGGALVASLGSALLLAGGGAARTALTLLAACAVVLTVAAQVGWVAPPGGLERWARRGWLRIAPIGRLASRRGDLVGVLALGLLWGWLPCGMVYAALALAGATADPVRGACVMAVFGLGTLPSMLGAGWLGARLRAGLPGSGLRSLRHLLASAVIGLTLWSAATALQHPAAHAPHALHEDAFDPRCVAP